MIKFHRIECPPLSTTRYNITKECPNSNLNSAGNLVFKLRYFDCDDELNLFYDSLVNTNKAKNLASKFIDANVVLSTTTIFQNKSNLIKVLNGEETTLLSSVFCIR